MAFDRGLGPGAGGQGPGAGGWGQGLEAGGRKRAVAAVPREMRNKANFG